jgi:CHAT domain-containing protein
LKTGVEAFAQATRTGDPHAVELGSRLYKDLFAAVPAVYLSHARWLLELDGPLFDLPFAALVAGTVDSGKRKNEPIYLIQRAALQDIPGALMLEPRTAAGDGGFLGIGDPIYNAADPRYRGNSKNRDVTLPRLNATAAELEACSRVWRPAQTRVLTGDNATFASVETALRSKPSIIHFATHIVAAPGDFSSGLIALSLDQSGAMGLMGPAGIVAHPVAASLVVLNGCHSGQGATLPGTGLMGLTRAWIGAGARSVVATRWDIPDDSGQTVMVEFYRALKAHPERGPAFALQQAQLTISLKSDDFQNILAILGGYFVLGRD